MESLRGCKRGKGRPPASNKRWTPATTPSGRILRRSLATLLTIAMSAIAQGNVLKVGALSNSSCNECWTTTLDRLNTAFPEHSFVLLPLAPTELFVKVRNGELDFLITDAALPVQLQKYGVRSIASASRLYRSERFAGSRAVLFTDRKRADLLAPENLRGGRIACLWDGSLEWLSLRRELQRSFIRSWPALERPLRLADCASVAAAVLDGRAIAGCLEAGCIERLSAEGKINPSLLRILEFPSVRRPRPWSIPLSVSTGVYPDWTFSACPRVSAELAGRVAAALLTMPEPPQDGKPGPIAAGWIPLQSDSSIHEMMRELRLSPYESEKVQLSVVAREYMYVFIAIAAVLLVMLLIILYISKLNRLLTAEITERKNAQGELMESVARFENVATCSADWIWETDEAGIYTYSNATVENMMGYSPMEVIGRHQVDFLAKSELDRLKPSDKVPLGDGRRFFRSRRLMLTRGGRVVIHECSAEPIMDQKGRLTGYRGVNRDVTSQARLVRLQ